MKHATRETISQTPSLKKRAEFLRVQNSGQKWVSPGVIVMVSPIGAEMGADQPGQVKFGLTVTKKLSKSAVVRNRIRRRLRAAAHDVLPLHAKKGVDYVLIGRHETADLSYGKLCSDLKWCLKRLSCLNETP